MPALRTLIVALAVAALAPVAEPAVESFPNIHHWRDFDRWSDGGPEPAPHVWGDYTTGSVPGWCQQTPYPTYQLEVIVAYDIGDKKPRTIKERCTSAWVRGQLHWRSNRIHAIENSDMAWNHHLEESRGWMWPQQIIAWRPVSASQGGDDA